MKRVIAMLLITLGLWRAGWAGDNPLGLKPDHVTASVADIERAISWYRDMLGFRLVDRGVRLNGAFKYADLAIPGFGIGLVQLPLSATPPSASDSSAHWLHMVFSVSDPAATYKLLKGRGVVVSTRTGSAVGPMTTFLIHDSEGNEIEIVAASSK